MPVFFRASLASLFALCLFLVSPHQANAVPSLAPLPVPAASPSPAPNEKNPLLLLPDAPVAKVSRLPIASSNSETPAPIRMVLPSALPSGNARNDGVVFVYYGANPAKVPATGAPVVVLLPYLGATDAPELQGLARYLAARGVAAALVTLPFHGARNVGDAPVNHFVNAPIDTVVRTWNQAASDVSTVVTWLEAQPGIDKTRIGGAGVSLGAIILHLVMGRDSRIGAGVALLGGGDLPFIFKHSLLTRIYVRGRSHRLTPAEETKLRTVDPLSYADQNRPRRVLMIEGARDLIIPPHAAQELWEALGRPPIIWTATNHLAPEFVQGGVNRASLEFLRSAWRGDSPLRAPGLYAPTLKIGLLSGLDSRLTPALTLEAFTLGHGLHHLPIAEFNVGYSGRGFFAGIATPLSQFIDLGLARRQGSRHTRPYLSFHVAF